MKNGIMISFNVSRLRMDFLIVLHYSIDNYDWVGKGSFLFNQDQSMSFELRRVEQVNSI